MLKRFKESRFNPFNPFNKRPDHANIMGEGIVDESTEMEQLIPEHRLEEKRVASNKPLTLDKKIEYHDFLKKFKKQKNAEWWDKVYLAILAGTSVTFFAAAVIFCPPVAVVIAIPIALGCKIVFCAIPLLATFKCVRDCYVLHMKIEGRIFCLTILDDKEFSRLASDIESKIRALSEAGAGISEIFLNNEVSTLFEQLRLVVRLEDVTDAIDELKERNKELTQEIENIKQKHAQAMEDMRKEIKQEHAQVITDIEDKHAQYINNLERQLAQRDKQHAQAITDMQKGMKAMMEQIEKIQASHQPGNNAPEPDHHDRPSPNASPSPVLSAESSRSTPPPDLNLSDNSAHFFNQPSSEHLPSPLPVSDAESVALANNT